MSASIHRLPNHRPQAPTLAEATDAFCARDAFEPRTADAYRDTLNRLSRWYDADGVPVDSITRAELTRFLDSQWGHRTPATSNRHRGGLISFFGWTIEQGWRDDNPALGTEPRKARKTTKQARMERPIPETHLQRLFERDDVSLRDKTLVAMLLETWARANEVLELDIEDLELSRKRALVVGKHGGDRELVTWGSRTSQLLPRLLKDGGTRARTEGPVFLTDRRAGKPLPACDLDPTTGRARLSYRRAEEIFQQLGREIDPHGAAWTLHRLRHTAITMAARTGRYNIAELSAKSRHQSLASLQRYIALGDETVERITEELDPKSRRKRRER